MSEHILLENWSSRWVDRTKAEREKEREGETAVRQRKSLSNALPKTLERRGRKIERGQEKKESGNMQSATLLNPLPETSRKHIFFSSKTQRHDAQVLLKKLSVCLFQFSRTSNFDLVVKFRKRERGTIFRCQ